MIKRILVALDGSTRSERSLPWVRAFVPHAQTVLLQVVESAYWSEVNPGYHDREVTNAKKYLHRVAQGFSPAADVLVEQGPTAPMILDAAERVRARMIALTSEGRREPSQRILGGVAEQLIHTADLPLLIVPAQREPPRTAQVKKIIVPLDGSELSELVLPFAEAAALRLDAEVILVHAWNAPHSPLEPRLEEIRSDLAAVGVKAATRFAKGEVPQAIHSACEAEGADMVFMSAHGHGGAARLMLGGTVIKLLRELDVPLVVVKYAAMRKLMTLAKESAKPTEV